MAYETGTATGVVDLLDKLRVFARNNGWTIDKSVGKELYLHKNNVGYFSLKCDDTIRTGNYINPRLPAIWLYGNTGFDNNKTVDKQPQSSDDTNAPCITPDLQPPFVAYHFFGGDSHVYIVIEVKSGEFAHFGFGLHEKPYNYSGGQFIYGTEFKTINSTYMSNALYANLPFSNITFANQKSIVTFFEGGWLPIIGGVGYQKVRDLFGNKYLHEDSPNACNHMAPLTPIINAVEKDGKTVIAGRVSNLRNVNLKHIAPNEIINYGGDEWICFPVKIKRTESPGPWEYTSELYGLAYKKS